MGCARNLKCLLFHLAIFSFCLPSILEAQEILDLKKLAHVRLSSPPDTIKTQSKSSRITRVASNSKQARLESGSGSKVKKAISKEEEDQLIARASEYKPVIYKSIEDLPRKPGYQALFPATTGRQITSPYSPLGFARLSRPRRETLLQKLRDRLLNRSSRSPGTKPRLLEKRKYRVSSKITGTGPPSSGTRYATRKPTRSAATSKQKSLQLLPSPSPTPPFSPSPSPPVFYDFKPSPGANDNFQAENSVSNSIYTFSTPPAPILNNVKNVYIKSPSSTTLNRGSPISSYGSSYSAPTAPVITSSRPSGNPIWRDQILNNYHKGNVHQTSGYKVPPVIVDNVKPSGPSQGLKTGYFPPSQRSMPRVNRMDAECSDDVMKLTVNFNDTFNGLIYSAGYAYDNDCVYINGNGENSYEFYIQLNRCGTLGGSDHNKKRDAANYKNKEPTKNMMWNTVTIQYNPLIEEEWDEHFKVTCEYGYDFWKTVTFPFLDVEVNTADPVHFTLTPPECHMEIRNGYGTSGTKVSGPVHVGDPLTLMVNMKSQWDTFDIIVNDCFAHNGANKKIQLIDHHGCPVDDKLISRFQGTWGMEGSLYKTIIYAHMKTFRFTGTPALYIECDIRMCHGRCPIQSCNWRSLDDIKRRKRRALDSAAMDESDDDSSILASAEELSSTSNTTSVSENVRIFQAIHVLQSREEEDSFLQNSTITSEVSILESDENVCMSSMIFASVIGTLSIIAMMSSVTVSLLCLRLRRIRSSNEKLGVDGIQSSPSLPYSSSSSMITRSNLSLHKKAEYIHSSQQRIP